MCYSRWKFSSILERVDATSGFIVNAGKKGRNGWEERWAVLVLVAVHDTCWDGPGGSYFLFQDQCLCKAVVAGLIGTHLIRMGDVRVWICEEHSRWMMCR